jgi:DNA-binding response OmpR family regulator
MTETKPDNKTTLFFVKNLNHPFGPVESFLKKRGYNVVVESDVKVGLDKIMEMNPEYIFLAWDHKNDAVRTMPKTIYQSCTGQVVPFIMSTQRDQIIQLENSGFENRLYPPLSGPAIVRVIAKYEKQNQIFDQINNKPSAPAKKQSEMIQVKSFFKEEDNTSNSVNVRSSIPLEEGQRKMMAARHRGQAQIFTQSQAKKKRALASITQENPKAELMTAISEAIGSTETLSEEQKAIAKNKLMSAVDKEFSNQGTQFNLAQAIGEAVDEIPDYHPEHQAELKAKLLALVDHKLDSAFPELNGDLATIDDATSSQLPAEIKKLSKDQIDFLDQSFSESVKSEMLDLIETYSDLEGHAALTNTTQIYVLAIQELEWTGYLMVASENHLDLESAQTILSNWIKQTIHIEQIDKSSEENEELPESVLFEMRVPEIDFSDLCSYKAEFFKNIEYEGKNTVLGFFSYSPFQVINSIHFKFDMLELSTTFLQPNHNLPFDVNLYLAENKKFITYLRAGSFLDDAQVSRLQTRKVEYIYSSMDYDLALLKYKAEFNLNALIEDYNRIKGTQK